MSRIGRIPPRVWVVYASMCLIFGTTFLAIKIGSNAGTPPFLASGLRFSVAGALLIVARSILFPRTPHRLRDVVNGGYLWRTAVLGIAIIGVTFAMTYSAADFIASGRIAQIQAVSPVLVTLMSVTVLGTMLTINRLAGLALGVTGVALLVGSAGAAGNGVAVVGALLAAGAEISYSAGSIWFRKAFSQDTDPILANGFSMFSGGIFLLVLAVFTGQTSTDWSRDSVLSLTYLIVFGSIGGHTMYLWLVSRVSAIFASTWLFVSPLIATMLGALVLNEEVTVWNVAGAAAVLTGVYFVQRSERVPPGPERDLAGESEERPGNTFRR